MVPNAFHDTMLVNGTAYPYVKVERKAYRLRILNACGDRQLNLQLYYAVSDTIAQTGPGGTPELQTDSGEIAMLPAVSPIEGGWPVRWPTDARAGGVPDPRAVGPTMIQIGNDGGLLPQAARACRTPRSASSTGCPARQDQAMGEFPSIVAVTAKALYLAPGERADVIVDFSEVPAGSKLILYNDAPAPAPNGDSRVDYYTGDVDQTAIGGAPATLAGYGPNTRTILQFQVDGPAAAPFDLERLQRALPAAYAAAQDPVLVPSAAYDAGLRDATTRRGDGAAGSLAGGRRRPSSLAAGRGGRARACEGGMQDDARSAQEATTPGVPERTPAPSRSRPLGRGYRLTLPVQGKMVGDLFDPTYGRKTATLGVDAPLSASGVRTAVPYSAIDPSTEYLAVDAGGDGATDGRRHPDVAHHPRRHHSRTASSFGGFDVQVVERARRDGAARAPDPGELGWKDTAARRPARVGAHRGAARAPADCPSSCRPARGTSTSRVPLGRQGRVHAARPGHGGPSGARGRQPARPT